MPVYEEYQAPPRRPRIGCRDVMPWRSMIAPGVLLQKYRHGLQRSYAVRGPDVMGESPEVQGALMLRANEVLKRLGGRWMLQSEAQRQRVTTLPEVRLAVARADPAGSGTPAQSAGGARQPGDALLHDAVVVAADGGDAARAAAAGRRGAARGGPAVAQGGRGPDAGAAGLPAGICAGGRLFHGPPQGHAGELSPADD